jgi:hypothetical protein
LRFLAEKRMVLCREFSCGESPRISVRAAGVSLNNYMLRRIVHTESEERERLAGVAAREVYKW